MSVPPPLEPLDIRVTSWMARHGINITRMALGFIFAWFGVLKLFPGASPAEDLATRTLERLTFGQVPPSTALLVLAIWEMLIGIGLLTGRLLRVTLLLLLLQMAGTLTPLALFPSETFHVFPFAPTLEGQYIIKNLVIIGAALVIGATVRGGYVRAHPPSAR
jgi:uncharacterized membrane protein YphA (DoxX/SURF4 family)